MPKYARVVKAPDGMVYACVSLDETRAVGIEDAGDRFILHHTSSGEEVGRPLCVVHFSEETRGKQFVNAIKWSCRWAGREYA